MDPRLETERLILRPHRIEDFDAYERMWAAPEVVRFIGGKPFDREATWSRFLRHAGVWRLLGFGFFALEDKATGAFLGEAGFHDLRRALAPSIEGTLEAGWALVPEAQGRGYVTEAMQAVLGWAETAFPGRRITCIIDPANTASVRVAGKLGFSLLAETTYHGNAIAVFERP